MSQLDQEDLIDLFNAVISGIGVLLLGAVLVFVVFS